MRVSGLPHGPRIHPPNGRPPRSALRPRPRKRVSPCEVRSDGLLLPFPAPPRAMAWPSQYNGAVHPATPPGLSPLSRNREAALGVRHPSRSPACRRRRRRAPSTPPASNSGALAVAQLDRLLDRLGVARLVVFTAGLVLPAVALASGQRVLLWGLVPLAGMLHLTAGPLRRRVAAAAAGAAGRARFYALGLDRLDGHWRGQGDDGTRYLDEDHPYAPDLDVFGPGSLFERLCGARTAPRRRHPRRLADGAGRGRRGPAAPGGRRRPAPARSTCASSLALLGADLPPVDYAPLTAWGQAAGAAAARRAGALAGQRPGGGQRRHPAGGPDASTRGWLPFAAVGGCLAGA